MFNTFHRHDDIIIIVKLLIKIVQILYEISNCININEFTLNIKWYLHVL